MKKRRPAFDHLESRRLCDGTGYPDLPDDVFAPTPYPAPPADGRDISDPLDELPLVPIYQPPPPGVVYPTVPGIRNFNFPDGEDV